MERKALFSQSQGRDIFTTLHTDTSVPDAVVARRDRELARLQALPRRERRALRARWRMGLAALALALALGGGLVRTHPARAATITVNGTTCTLAEAIAQANDTTTGDLGNGCAVGNPLGADTIVLQTGVSLTSALPNITSEITINGDNNTIQRIGGGAFRVLTVISGDLTLNQATISGGSASFGGGIANLYGTVTVNNSTISDNTATSSGGGINTFEGAVTVIGSTISGNTAGSDGGGIYNHDGPVSVQGDSTVSGNSATTGGGIFNADGTLTVESSTVSGNSASFGGGIQNQDHLTVSSSTISGNSVSSFGGGIRHTGSSTAAISSSTFSGNSAKGGGAIHNVGPMRINTCTLSGNSASLSGGGIQNHSYNASVSASTITGNSAGFTGAGLYNFEGSLTVSSSIVAVQTAGSDCWNYDGGNVSNGYNLESGTSCGFTNGANGDLQNTDPLLAPLADNGGPTLTHFLQTNSPAIDTGSCPAGTDQRGQTRPVDVNDAFYPDTDNACDIGAVEIQNVGPNTVTLDRLTAYPEPGSLPTGSLLAAILAAAAGLLLRRKRKEN